jgi:two-component system response regulator NreC
MSHRTRVLLADDHETVRQGLRALFENSAEVEVVGDVADGDAAVQAVERIGPDLVILDLSMPPGNGLVAIRRIKESSPRTPVVVLTRYRDAAYVSEALAAGASGYVLKQSPFSELMRAVRDATLGDRHLDAALTRPMEADEPPAPVPTGRATPREIAVLRRAAIGHSNKDIAAELGIALKTVEVHKANAMRKLNLRSRSQIVRYAALQGWLRDP